MPFTVKLIISTHTSTHTHVLIQTFNYIHIIKPKHPHIVCIHANNSCIHLYSGKTRGGWSSVDIILNDNLSPAAVVCHSTQLTIVSLLVSSSSQITEAIK